MNKTLILILAVCLVSCQAFVKRDAPVILTGEGAPKNGVNMDEITKQLETIAKDAKTKLDETFSPDNLKKTVEDIQASLNKALEDLKNAASNSQKQ